MPLAAHKRTERARFGTEAEADSWGMTIAEYDLEMWWGDSVRRVARNPAFA